MTWLFIRSAALTTAFETIIYRWQRQPFFPAVNKEMTLPMFLFMSCLLFSALLSLAITLELVQQHPRRNPFLWCCRFLFLLRLLTLGFIGRYLCFGINNPDSLADCDVSIFVCNAFPFFPTSIMFAEIGCPSIFIGFFGVSNLSLPCSIADCIC